MGLSLRLGGVYETRGDSKLTGALRVAEQIQDNITQLAISHPNSEVSQHLTLSIGVASLHPGIGSEPTELVSLADDQLYQAKNNGRNQIHCQPIERLV
jgi:diguanylate cyclase (GGDEF)-like protein